MSWLSRLWWEYYTMGIGRGNKASLLHPLGLWTAYQHATGGSPLSSAKVTAVSAGFCGVYSGR